MRIDAVLVPQGAEHWAVCRGLKRANVTHPAVIPIPMGAKPLTAYLKSWSAPIGTTQPRILLMGLCGSLWPAGNLGDTVLYRGCIDAATAAQRDCDRPLTAVLHQQLNVPLVQGVMSDRFVWSSAHKQRLGRDYQADVVDMEGFAALEILSQTGMAVAMVRVVSDVCEHDLPDLNPAIGVDGSLEFISLTLAFLKQPLAAAKLIQGSIRGLKKLQQVTTQVFSRVDVI
ncbi:MAG: phosphorylase [Cyanophyceae cyanobacterium]